MKWVCDHRSESQFKQLQNSPKKSFFGASTGFEPVASAFALQCSTSLSYEDPYTGGRPIYWVHQPVKGMKHRMTWCELQEYKWNEYVTIAVNRNLSNCEKARKKGFRGFNGIWTRGLCISAAVLYQPELWRPIHWSPANLLSSSTRERNETQNDMMWTAGIQWNEYVTIAVNRNLSNCEMARKKVFWGFKRIWTCGLCVHTAVLYQPELWRPIRRRPANLLSSSTCETNG